MQSPTIKIDTLKPIGTLVDLTGQFNARVGDAFTPITIQWTEGGNAKNLDGLHPVFEAVVGQGHVENNEVLMNDDAVPVRWVGDQSSIRGYGQTILKLPPQVFSKSGLCYGYLALENDQGVRETSVDIWFKVLGGVYNMGLACNYFITDFQKALAKAKGDVFQALDEIKKNYELKIQSAENAIDDNVVALKNLKDSVGAIQAQIDAGNVVTLTKHNTDIDRISKAIEDKLAQMNLQPEAFENETALKAKYPNGKAGIMVTTDTGHMWLYLGTWHDCGPFQTASLGLFNQLPGINLIDGTSTDTQHVGPGIYGKDSNVIDVSRRLDSNLTWSFSIKNLTGNVFVKVKYKDQVGDFLNLDGSINNGAQFGTATGYVVKPGINVTYFTLPANATSMIVTLACDTKSEFDIANSMLTYGTRQMPWKPSLKDSADPARQIAQMIANLDDLLDTKKVDVAANTHLNLLHVSPNTWTHAVGSHDSDWISWDPQAYGNLLTYAVKLKHINSANDHGVYFTIRMIDSVGTPIDLSGKEISTAYTNVVVSPDNIKTNTDYVKTIALPANAAKISMTITTADTSDSYDYCDETIIAGSRADMPLENFDNDDNLIPNTHAWESHIGPGLYSKQTDWFDVTGGRTLHWSITIANATDIFYPAIILKDSKGNQINLDGTAGDNQLIGSPLRNQDYTATARTQFVGT